MKKIKLTDLQKHKLRTAYKDAADVLREIKAKPLTGEKLKEMKTLEEAVQLLEITLH